MSAAEDTININGISKPGNAPILDRFINAMSSVRFGVIFLCCLVVLAMIGMLIVQQNVQGFEAYYASLTPAEKLVYGTLGFFDIYHSWYFNLLLLSFRSTSSSRRSTDFRPPGATSLNQSSKPAERGCSISVCMTLSFCRTKRTKKPSSNACGKRSLITAISRRHQKRPHVVRDRSRRQEEFADIVNRHVITVFGQKGKINRLGAYIVHVALLTLFLGHFVALQTGFDADVRIVPGETTSQIQLIQFELDKKEKFNVQLPFEMECTDIQQRLIDPRGSIAVTNTLDWRTQLKVDDPQYGSTIADISMNQPFTYRGYRFFQAQTIPIGNARNIRVDLTPAAGGDKQSVEIKRNGSTTLPDGTNVEYTNFLPDFTFNAQGEPDTRSGEYKIPSRCSTSHNRARRGPAFSLSAATFLTIFLSRHPSSGINGVLAISKSHRMRIFFLSSTIRSTPHSSHGISEGSASSVHLLSYFFSRTGGFGLTLKSGKMA